MINHITAKSSNVIIILIFNSIVTLGQTSSLFVPNGSSWVSANTSVCCGLQPNYYSQRNHLEVKGDTLVNGDTIQKVYYKKYAGVNITLPPYNYSDLTLSGFFKLSQNKVLYGPALDSLKTLYDFNLAIGDSFSFNLFQSQNPVGFIKFLHVIATDSIVLGSRLRKRITFESITDALGVGNINIQWIEGAGELTYGPCWKTNEIQSMEVNGNPYLQCFREGATPLSGICSTLGAFELEEKTEIFIYPNPSRDYIGVNFKSDNRIYYKIYTLMGTIIQEAYLTDNMKIDLRDFKVGMYLISLYDNRKQYQSTFIKQ